MPKISATIITFNEERNIQRCLQSLQGIADEIVVVDSFSTDTTEQICRSFNVNFISHAFEGHIEQKNFAVQHAVHDFILALDADEVLSDDLRSSILQVKEHWTAQAYQFNRLNNYCGRWIKHGLWYPDRKIRLWERRCGEWGGKNPHDKVILRPGSQVKKLKGDLLHYTAPTQKAFYNQLDKFSSIQAAGLRAEGFRPNFFHFYFKPAFKFLTAYLFRVGFLDGRAGYQIAKGQAWSVLQRYLKVKGR